MAQRFRPRAGRPVSRRAAAPGIFAATLAFGARMPGRGPGGIAMPPALWTAQQAADIVLLSTQLAPDDEAAAMRSTILSGYPGTVDFVPSDPMPLTARIVAESSGEIPASVGVVGALHGDFVTLAAQDLLAEIDDLAADLAYRAFIAPYLDLARLGGDRVRYLPWMQATYLMAARREALRYLPGELTEGSLRESITYDQLVRWAEAIAAAAGPRFGLPAGPTGLIHRFLQGYLYPSFTGGVTTTFASEQALPAWEWLRRIWKVAASISIDSDAMSAPLSGGTVWLCWDHTARLLHALREDPSGIVVFPAPIGPRGRAFTPVLAGLAPLKSAPDQSAARALIDFLTRPETQTTTLREVGFFPAIELDIPSDLPPAIQAEAAAVGATVSGDAVIPSLLPVGLGPAQETYNSVFRNAFRAIILEGQDARTVLDEQAPLLQAVLDAAAVPCWPPDQRSAGICRVG